MAEGFGRGIAIASILLAVGAVGLYGYVLTQCTLGGGETCTTMMERSMYAAGLATFLGLAALLAILTGEALFGRALIGLTALAALAGAALFFAGAMDGPTVVWRWAGYAVAAMGGLALLSATFAWRRAA